MTRLRNCWKALTGKGNMSDSNTKGDVEAVAALVGTVNASLGQIDEQIISTSANLQQSKDNWDPKAVLKEELKAQGVGGLQPAGPSPMSQPSESLQQPAMHEPVPGYVQPVMQQPVMQQPVMQQPAAFITDPQILDRLDKIEEVLRRLTLTEEKIMKNLLKNNTKQITIRFDDNKSSK